MITQIKQLAEISNGHPYYCSDSNYDGLNFDTQYNTWVDFYNSMGGARI